MKYTLIPLTLLAFLFGCTSAFSAAPPVFSPEAPEKGAQKLVEAYLPLLASGEFEQAIPMNDLRGMREYFLSRRLAELRSQNPGLTELDLKEMSAQIQMNSLNPLRLQEILRNVLEEGDFKGMSWAVQGYAPAPMIVNGYLVNIEAVTDKGHPKPIILGIKKLGTQWMVAPEIVERIARLPAPATQAPEQRPPSEVAALVATFWTHWKQGELNDVHALMGAEYRERVPLLPFLQQAQKIISDQGIPLSWTVAQSRVIAPSVLGLGVDVESSKSKMQSIMIFRKMGETWVLEDVQFRPASGALSPAAEAPPEPRAPSLSRPDLRPDFQTPAFSAPPSSPRPVRSNSPALD